MSLKSIQMLKKNIFALLATLVMAGNLCDGSGILVYEIYTFFSGAAITMKDFPNLNVYAIKPTSLPKDYFLNPVQKLYQQVGIQILEFKDK